VKPPIVVPDDLICQAHLTRRSTETRVDAHRRLSSKLSNDFARRQTETQVLDDLACAAYPGAYGAEARYESARFELLKRLPPDERGGTEGVLQMAFAAGMLAGQRSCVRDIGPFVWRAATELDL